MKILVVYSKPISYNALETFADILVESLRSMGHDVSILTSFDFAERFVPHFNTSYDRIIDFNSTLPRMKLDDGTYVLSHLQGEFYNYLIDHPLYHHKDLAVKDIKQSVICVDRSHAEYVRKYYPHIEKVLFIPIGRMPAEKKKKKQIRGRNIPILFTGTYTSANWACAKLSVCHPQLKDELIYCYENMRNDYSLQLEDVLRKYVSDKQNSQIENEQMGEYASLHFLAEVFLAAHARDRVVRTLIEAHVPITVCGGGWDEFDDPYKEYLTVLPAKDYDESLEMAYDTRMLLNITPHFAEGVHNRVLTAMSHGAVSITDSNEYIRECFEDNKNLILYDWNHLDELPRVVMEYLEDESQLQRIADAANHICEAHYTWEKLIEESELLKD